MTFYNIGAGSFRADGWTNVDMASEHYAPLQAEGFIEYDLMALAPLPIETASAALVYCGHTIEHVTDAAVRNVLAEAHRILCPGGTLRLTTPCAELIWRAYHNRDLLFFYELAKSARAGSTSPPEAFLDMFGSQLCANNKAPSVKWSDMDVEAIVTSMERDEALEYIAHQCEYNREHPQNHINWFTADKLKGMLREAGFRMVHRSGAGQSAAPEMRDLTKFDHHFGFSLYMEATR